MLVPNLCPASFLEKISCVFGAPPYREGQSSGFLTMYRVQSKESTDIGRRTPISPNNFHLSFFEAGTRAGAGDKIYIVGADGSGLRQLPQTDGMNIYEAVWSPDQKSIYLSHWRTGSKILTEISKWNLDGSNPEKFVDNCADAADINPSGQYLLSVDRVEKRLESTRCRCATGNVPPCSRQTGANDTRQTLWQRFDFLSSHSDYCEILIACLRMLYEFLSFSH